MTDNQFNDLMDMLGDIYQQNGQLGEIRLGVENIKYDTLEIRSGDAITRELLENNHNEMMDNVSIYTGCINLILMVTLLLSLLPAKKGVAKK